MTITHSPKARRGLPMTALERSRGRLMRSPEGHVDAPVVPPVVTPPVVPPVVPPVTPPAVTPDAAAVAEVARLQAELAARDAMLANFGDLDPAAARAAIAERDAAAAATAAAERAAAEAAGNWERVRELMNQERDAKEAALQAQIAELRNGDTSKQQQLDNLTIDREFNSSKFVRSDVILPPEMIRHLFGEHVDVVDGQAIVFDKPRGAKDRTMVVDGAGKALGFNEAITKVITANPNKDTLLKSEVKPGAKSRSDGRPETETGKTRQQLFSEGFAALRAKR